MNLAVFRTRCADKNATDQELLGLIMELKRTGMQFTDAEKDEICTILKINRRIDLAEKIRKSMDRHRKHR
jgi:hypothetical protein